MGISKLTSTLTTIIVFAFFTQITNAQDTIITKRAGGYKLKPVVDVPVVVGCAAWCGFTLTQIYTKGPSTEQQILDLNVNDINPLDRGFVRPYNHSEDRMSYYPFYASFPLPLAFMLTSKGMRHDYWKLCFLYMESMAMTGLLGSSATYFVNQYRPYAYSSSTSMDQRMIQNAKNSFYAGHVEIVATSTFFMAEVYAGYYPQSKVKWLFFGLATAATAGMGYLRMDAGMHFPSDVILGAATGMLSGILVPYFHNHRIIRTTNLTIMPFGNSAAQGLSMTYTFNKQTK